MGQQLMESACINVQIIPNLRNWEEVLFLTDVPSWSPHAVFQATRLFVSSLNSRLVWMIPSPPPPPPLSAGAAPESVFTG